MRVNYSRTGDVHTIETTNSALGNIVIDNTGISGADAGNPGKQLLASAALFCYADSVHEALSARNVRYSRLELSADLEIGKNEEGRNRVFRIVITANIGVDDRDAEAFEHVSEIMRNGCMVTGSIHDGIEMEYRFNRI